MLRPKKITHRPPELITSVEMKRAALAVCTYLTKTGMTLIDAAKAVSKTLKSAGFSNQSKGPLTYKTILNWRVRYDSEPNDYMDPEDFDEELKTMSLGQARQHLLIGLAKELRANCLDRI